MSDVFNSRSSLIVGERTYTYYRLPALEAQYKVSRLPYSLKILLENLLRTQHEGVSSPDDIEALLRWSPTATNTREVAFTPARTILQDFTGVPCVVDLAAMRDAMKILGGNPDRINPLSPVELVIDHSVQVDRFGSVDAFDLNSRIELERNRERYVFLRWGQNALANFKVVPPDTGIVHQVNLEHLARVVFEKNGVIYPDTLVGTDSHTTMVNGLGVLGWGVGGIEAEAAMLGQAITMLIPQVIGFRFKSVLPEGATATDLVLTVTEILRKKGVVGKFVEFFGDGLSGLPLADRATIANMAPEYGATCGIFPIDQETLSYLRLTGRREEQVALVESYAKAQGLWRYDDATEAEYSETLELDLGAVQPSIAGPRRPQDRLLLGEMQQAFRHELSVLATSTAASGSVHSRALDTASSPSGLTHGSVVIAAITSCTNTSNPAVLVAAGLLARNAVKWGLRSKPWVKTSLAPGSKVVSAYLEKAGLMRDLESLGFNLVGYGCTTCIGNSGPLPTEVSAAIAQGDLAVAAVLSGNRNFEGRVHPEVRLNYLASPPLVVAYALTGTMDVDLTRDAIGEGADGSPVYLRDVWPSQADIQAVIAQSISSSMYRHAYSDIYEGDDRWRDLEVPDGNLYAWDSRSTYIARPPYFDDMPKQAPGIHRISGARCLALLGDSITTDHISPAGSISKDSPAGHYLVSCGVQPKDFNSYGARRGNHEVMVRGTFANIRIRNRMVPGVEGGVTRHFPSGEQTSIYEAAMRYRDGDVPLLVVAGKEYGTGSSRDWAAKGTLLLGVRAVIAESFERIHRSNLVGMGVLPLCFSAGDTAASLEIDGTETFDLDGLEKGVETVTVSAVRADGGRLSFVAHVRIDTPKEWEYYLHGGILQYVLRHLVEHTSTALDRSNGGSATLSGH